MRESFISVSCISCTQEGTGATRRSVMWCCRVVYNRCIWSAGSRPRHAGTAVYIYCSDCLLRFDTRLVASRTLLGVSHPLGRTGCDEAIDYAQKNRRDFCNNLRLHTLAMPGSLIRCSSSSLPCSSRIFVLNCCCFSLLTLSCSLCCCSSVNGWCLYASREGGNAELTSSCRKAEHR